MSINPCILIPVYNHGAQLPETLRRLKHLDLPCLLVDDGSDAQTAAVIDQLLTQYHWLQLYRLSSNSGKGVAVLRGITKARRLGYSHAVQVDADGQHAVEDIPSMLALAAAAPEALISGSPIYDDSVPASRLYGRYITHFWVWVETLSFEIKDSMCGFRVYPVQATDDLAQRYPIGKRMDFDTDIMVRLYWQGVPVKFLATRVNYPEQGLSHFQLWADNWRISKMHSRLFFGMLPRIPKLVSRKRQRRQAVLKTATHWSDMRESGTYAGMAITVACYRAVGRRGLSPLLYIIIGYFFLSNRRARTHSQQFLQRVYRLKPQAFNNHPPKLIDSFHHFMAFGRVVVDRIGSWVGDIKRDEVVFENRQLLLNSVKSGRGAVILSSHLGNAELSRALVNGVNSFKINVLVFNDNAEQINRMMKRINPQADVELIQISAVGPETGMLLNDKINRGEFIVIAADRTSPTAPEQSTVVPFMGQPAAFPKGAFILAGLLECPVFLMFCLKRQQQYQIYLEPFADTMAMPRRQRATLLREYTTRYAERLEHYALSAPLQWFNFFDFWSLPTGIENQQQHIKTATQKSRHE